MRNLILNFFKDLSFSDDQKSSGKDEILKNNLGRLTFLVYLGLPVTLFHILLFLYKIDEALPAEFKWRKGIIIAHSLAFISFLIIGSVIFYIHKKKLFHLRVSKTIPHITFFIILLLGTIIAGIDQSVTNAITPFVIVCLMAAMIIYINPLYSAIYYLLIFTVFFLGMNHFQLNHEIRLSNYVNGFTIISISWFLSLTLWRNYLVRFRASWTINNQQTELEMQNAQLKIIANELSEANQTKDKLFSIISHDLRGPLSNLDEILKMLQKQDITETDFKDILPELSKQTSLTNDLLENLLSWSYSNLKGNIIKREEFDIANLLNEIIQLYHSQIKGKSLDISNQVDIGSIVLADKSMIAVVIRNLISNAIKFSKTEGKIHIYSKLNESFLYIYIQDNGTGIPVEQIGLLFSNQNFSTSGTKGEKGTGLGLILCQDFINKNGGEIKLENTSSSGSTFCFSIPLIKHHQATPEK